MRVIAGQFRGLHLRALRGMRVRPTTDRVRESVFAILRHDVPGARVLDLFAGSGSLGIEALSRGAAHATFVDAYGPCLDTVRRNLEAIRAVPQSARLIRADVTNALELFETSNERFDIVFVDPPYDSNLANEALRGIGMSRIVTDNGVVVVEHAHKTEPADFFSDLARVRVELYGETAVSFYRRVRSFSEPA
jgi:16S rRNA (guanine(966)-N(2))-methyltransferase RsmD